MDEITVGSIVRLHSDTYKVLEVQMIGSRLIPKQVQALNTDGSLSSIIHKDTYGGWSTYKWELISDGKPFDPKERIITKIKYLENKFKERQAAKAKEKELTTAAAPPVPDEYIYSPEDFQRLRQMIRGRQEEASAIITSYYTTNTTWGTTS